MKRIALAAAALSMIAAAAFAGPLAGHPNLKKAEKDIADAIEHVTAAQKANEYDMAGHAAKAKELLDQAAHEIAIAAEAANEHK